MTCPPNVARATLLPFKGHGKVEIEYPRDEDCQALLPQYRCSAQLARALAGPVTVDHTADQPS
eukprot:12160122-Alexandrium_andersonii.AAC.1